MSLLLLFQPGATDVTAPVLSNPRYSGPGATTVTPIVDTDEGNGIAYHVILTSGAAAPSGNQVKAGTDGLGAPGVASDSKTVTSTGLQVFTQVTGLTISTTYDIYFVHEDSVLNQSNVVNTSFTTLASNIMADDYTYQERAIRGSAEFIASNYVTTTTLTTGVATVFTVPTAARAFKIENTGTGDMYVAYGEDATEATNNLAIAGGVATQGHEYFEDTTAAKFESEAIRVLQLPRLTKSVAVANATVAETPTFRSTFGK